MSEYLPRGGCVENGINPKAIYDFVKRSQKEKLGVDSFMVIKGGTVVAEGYHGPYTNLTPHVEFSLSKSITATALGMVLTVMTAYATSRKDAIWGNAIMFFITFTMMFNGGMIAYYIIITKGLNMFDSRLALILPVCLSAYNLIIVRTAMKGIPESLIESAQLDGAGHVRVLVSIVLPLMKATLATVILYYVVAHWNSWFQASIFLRDRSKFPLQLILKEILITGNVTTTITGGTSAKASDYSGDLILYKQTVKYCTIVVSTLPIFIFYPFIQKYFESGVLIGAIKG